MEAIRFFEWPFFVKPGIEWGAKMKSPRQKKTDGTRILGTTFQNLKPQTLLRVPCSFRCV